MSATTSGQLVSELDPTAGAVVHYAAETHLDNAIANPEPILQSNLIGTFAALEAVRVHGIRLHHVSTDEVYGDLELDSRVRFTEATPYNASSPYRQPRRPPTCWCGMDTLVRRAGHDLELLQQLWRAFVLGAD